MVPLFRPPTLSRCVIKSLLRCPDAFSKAVKFSYDGTSKAACDSSSLGRSSATGSSIKVPGSRSRDGLHYSVITVVPGSKWDQAHISSSRSIISCCARAFVDSSSRHANRERVFPSLNGQLGVSAASLLAAPIEAGGALKTAADAATPGSPRCSEPFVCPRKVLVQPWTAAAHAAAVAGATTNAGRSEVAGKVGFTTTESTAAGPGAIRTVTEQVKSARGTAADAAQEPAASAADKPTATDSKQCLSRRLDLNAAVPPTNQRKQLWRTACKPLTAAAQEAALNGFSQVSRNRTVSLIGWVAATPFVQARTVARCCRVHQRRTENVAGAGSDTARLQSTGKRAGVGGSESVKGNYEGGSVPLSFDPVTPADTVTATLCGSGLVRARRAYTAGGTRVGGRGLFSGLFIKYFTSLPGNGEKKSANFPEDHLFSAGPGSGTTKTSSAPRQENRGAATASRKQEEGKQQAKTRDAAQGQFVFQSPPRGQRLLGLLAALGACISLMLLYERSLLDSAALLYGAWDAEWDASWRASGEQYEAELAAKGVQLRPSGLQAAASDAGEMPAAPLRPPTRQIILVRHGQYHLAAADEERGLTDLGRRQAAATGRRLQELLQGQRIQAVIHSNMKRARETAEIIQESGGFKTVPLVEDALLAEGAPAEPVPPSDSFWPSPTDIAVDGPRIEQAFRRYFYRARHYPSQVASPVSAGSASLFSASHGHADAALPSGKAPAATAADPSPDVQSSRHATSTDSFIILVCHGNVIRYFLMRALQLPACAWLRWALPNAGLTWISIDARGRVSCRSFGDVGHLSTHMISYN